MFGKYTTCFFLCLSLSISFSKAQLIEFTPPEKFPKSVNSDSEESMPLLTPDGRQLYFTRTLFRLNTGGENSGQDIWVSHKKEDGSWTKANNNFPEWNNKFNNSIIGISQDGKTVYLLNSYQVEGQTKGLAFSRFVNGQWSKPERIRIKGLNLTGYIGFYMNSSYDILIISMEGRDSMGGEDLYVSFLGENGKWSNPKNLGPTINSAGFEISPFLSEDKRTLYFSTNGRIGYGGADVYRSQRLYDSWEVWSAPENLGPNVNSENFDAYFSIYDTTAFFVSSREGGLSDIYRTTMNKNVVTVPNDSVNLLISEAQAILEELKVQNPEASEKSTTNYSKFISFEYNSDVLNPRSTKQLDKIIDEFKSLNEEVSIYLIAFSDELENQNLDEELSNRRIESVKRYLLDKKINKEKIFLTVTSNKNLLSKNKTGVEIFTQ